MKAVEMRSMRPAQVRVPTRQRERGLRKNTRPEDQVERVETVEVLPYSTGVFQCRLFILTYRIRVPVKHPGIR